MNKIAELRTKAGITQKEFGKQLNVAQTPVSSWENGKSEPSLDTLQKIAELLNTSVDEVLGKEAPTRYVYASTRDENKTSLLTDIVADFMEKLPTYEQIRIIHMLKLMYGEDFYCRYNGCAGVRFANEENPSDFSFASLQDILTFISEDEYRDFDETYMP